MIIEKLVSIATRVAESHPYPWKLAWEALHHIPILLPHDRSYFALRHFIRAAPAGLFLDVGANDGISALSFRRFDRTYRILSLEPNLMLEPHLRKLKSKDPNFEYRMIGAGLAPARLRFFVPVYHGIVLHTFVSSSVDHVLEGIRHCFGESVAAKTVIKTVDSEVVRLDDLNLDPTIVKIDAEGFDHEVLRGLEATLVRARPFVISEMSWGEEDQSQKFLETLDYTIFAYDKTNDRFRIPVKADASRAPGGRNVFAIPREKLELLPPDCR